MSNQQLIQELAYQIWESEGRPNGQSAKHWKLASILVETDNETESRSTSQETLEDQQPDQT